MASRTRIYNDRCYLVGIPQGISGFPQPAILAVVSGRLYRRDRVKFHEAPRMGNLNARIWRLDDGHLPDHQPRATYDEACAYVLAHPWQAAYCTEHWREEAPTA